MTIQPNNPQTHRSDALAEVALAVLGWILADEGKAQRFLDATGLTPDALRASLASPDTQRAIIDFLCAFEPDLISASAELGMDPAHIARLGTAPWERDIA